MQKFAEEKLSIPSTTNVILEARLFRGYNRNKSSAVIITHPYGPLGGNLHNNVVEEVYMRFAEGGFTAVRFNFRGVGKSTGWTSWQGTDERDDVVSVANYILKRPDLGIERIILCGYSYGSVAACSAIEMIPQVSHLICISYPYNVTWFLTFFNSSYFQMPVISSTIPKLFIAGTVDQFCLVSQIKQFVGRMQHDTAKLFVVEWANHFWFGQEEIVTNHIWEWISGFRDDFEVEVGGS